jgi:serine/threonine protein kinase
MITDALGPSLEEIFCKSNRFIEISLLLEIAGQLIFRLEWVHSHHVSHGNLSPHSFAMGSSTKQTPQVILADFTSLDRSEDSAQNDLLAVGNILLYLSMGCSSWETFQS